MSGRRLFAAELPEAGGRVELDQAAARHARVLRLAPGDPVRLFDGQGREAEGRVVALLPDRLSCEVGPAARVAPGPRVVLVQSMPKGGKPEGIVRMATELGVAEVRLALSARSVARPDVSRAAARLERLVRVAREAARQAGRADVPVLVEPAPLVEVAAQAPETAWRLVFWEGARVPLGGPPDGTREAWIVVGPEGGLGEAEVEALAETGFSPVRLGPTVLRVETAAPVAVALVMDRLGAFDGSARAHR